MSENIIQKNMLEQFKNDMALYGISVNLRRMIPGIDGLKLVHRRILYAMGVIMGVKYNSKHIKSASIIGRTMEVLHPHGDSSIYGAMTKLGNWFDNYQVLIDKQGSFGTFQGYPPAAYRYTEARLSEFAQECILGEMLEIPNIVDYHSNFDNTSKEPEYFPIKVPLPLINGYDSIAFGLKTFMPSHNLKEVLAETIKVLDDPNHKVFLVPDQCQPCIIIGDEFEKICETGVGSFKVRGIIDIEENGKSYNLVIKSCPDKVTLEKVVETLEKLISKNKIIGISDIVDESTIANKPKENDIMRLVIKLKQGSDPNYIRELIYQYTSMQQSFSTSFELIEGVQKIRFNYNSYIRYFIDFRMMVKFRYYNMKLSEANTEHHKLDAYVKVLQSGEIDKIISMVRKNKAKDYDVLVEFLIDKCKLTDLQAKYILSTRIASLSEGNLPDYLSKLNKVEEEINKYRNMITNQDLIKQEMKEELIYISNKYGTPRRSKIFKGKNFSNIPEGTFNIVIDHNNYIRKLNINDPLSNKYGQCKMFLQVDNKDSIIIFDDMGRCFSYEVHKIPLVDKLSAGIDIKAIIKNATSNIIGLYSLSHIEKLNKIKNNSESVFKMMIVTKYGFSKKISLDDIISTPKSGIFYTKLSDNNYVINITPVSNDTNIFIFNKNKCLKLNSNDILEMKRNSMGSRTISSEVSGVTFGDPNNEFLFILTIDGKYNLIINSAVKYGNKNTLGSNLIKTGNIVSIIPVNINDSISVQTTNDIHIFNISDLKQGSTISSGIQLLAVKQNPIVNVYKN